jgi:hypothetical protein
MQLRSAGVGHRPTNHFVMDLASGLDLKDNQISIIILVFLYLSKN